MMWTLLLLPFIDSEMCSTSSSDEWWLKWQILWQTSKQRGILWMWFPWYFSTYRSDFYKRKMAEWKAKKCIHQYFVVVVLILTKAALNFGFLPLFLAFANFLLLFFLFLFFLQSKRRNGRQEKELSQNIENLIGAVQIQDVCILDLNNWRQ